MTDALTDPGFLKASEEIAQHLMVTLDTSAAKTLKIADSPDDVFGVCAKLTKIGEAVTTRTADGAVVRVLAGAAFSLGDKLAPGTGVAKGKAITAATSGAIVAGRALEAATAADEIVLMMIEKTVLP